jgi:hypothetical protein
MTLKAPFKGRPASELVNFTKECLDVNVPEEHQLERFNQLTLFLLDMDSDCLPRVKIETPSENPTGLQHEAMLQKMDIILETIISRFSEGVSESFYHGLLEIFENSVLKLYHPHYIQFVTYYLAASSKEHADSFLSLLLNIIHDNNADPIARREGISFLGSFAVRAKVLSWTHSARTAKYLVSFMHSLNITGSSVDRTLFVLCLQTVFYMICWECDRWREHVDSPELDWVWRSKKGLVPLISTHRQSGILRLVCLDILKTLHTVSGRISLQLRELVIEGIETYKQLLPPMWKSVSESKLLKPNFPFDPFNNLPRATPLIEPLCREWSEPIPNVAEVTGEPSLGGGESGMEDTGFEDMHAVEDDVWSFHPITRALTGGGSYLPSPVFGHSRPPINQEDDISSPLLTAKTRPGQVPGHNIILERIISSDKFASAP